MLSLKKTTTLLILAGALALPTFASARTTPAAATSPVSSIERRVLADGVAEYFFTIRVGSGPYDQIGVHRVVKETAPNVPAHASRAVFLAPGDIWNFRAAFLTGAHPIPVFLAQNGVDVWGIDYRWTFVPASVTDLSFMKDWGLEQDARDLGVAIGAARVTRALTGSGFGKVFLLGWSRGGQVGYAYLNGETQLPPGLRQVKGFIPVDIYLKTDVPDFQAKACQRAQGTEAAIAAGNYAATSGGLIEAIGNAAVANPNGASAVVPGFNNRQAGLFVGEATFALLGGLEPVPFYHFTGGTFDAQGAPSGLLYSNEGDLFHFEIAASPFQPNRELADADTATCGQVDVRFDDHLAQIKVPVLYIGAGGGFGQYGLYTLSLLGSTDVTTHIVSLSPVRIADFGHADLFLATQAPTLAWQPILDWVRAR
jgi:pimeloyl-ACP methyl ester carboxylesterase